MKKLSLIFATLGCFIAAIFVPVAINAILADAAMKAYPNITEQQWMLMHSLRGTVFQHWLLAGQIGAFAFLWHKKKYPDFAKLITIAFSVALGCLWVKNLILISSGIEIPRWVCYTPGLAFIGYHLLRYFFSDAKFRPIH